MENKKILSGVPAMWYGNPSAVCYIGSVMRLMEYLGDPIEQDELFSLCGAGLCFPWRFSSCCDEVSVVPDIPARTFKALGYESEYLKGEAVGNKADCFEKIKLSIDRGNPVIGFGITTKMPMSCLIVGYDDNGLYTRSFWPPEGAKRDSDEYFYSTDWFENCSGLLLVGDKTGERLTGVSAYAQIVKWAEYYRWKYKSQSVTAEGQEIYLNERAFEEMIKWLLDDGQWKNPNEDGKEQFLKQCGLLLFGHYRRQLFEYLKKLDAEFPGIVNKPVFGVLESIGQNIPGAHISDLWLYEAVDPALKDFSAMENRELREKVADYVRKLQGYDNSVQWTLFMPDFVKNQTKGFIVENFEYLNFPAMKLIGIDDSLFHSDTDEEYHKKKNANLKNMLRPLDNMTEYSSGFDYIIKFMHHYGHNHDECWHCAWGKFMKADAPVPEGFISIDFVPSDIPEAGPPYYSQFAFARFSGDMDKLHSNEGFDANAMYDITRNIVLGDGINIPYPEKYWTAEVFLDGCDKPGTGYLFSTGGPHPGR